MVTGESPFPTREDVVHRQPRLHVVTSSSPCSTTSASASASASAKTNPPSSHYYDGDDLGAPREMMMDHRGKPSVSTEEVSPMCANLILWMLEKDPKQRATLNDILTHPWMMQW